MKSLIVIGHPEENSFCYNGIFKTILKELKENSNEVKLLTYTDAVSQDLGMS